MLLFILFVLLRLSFARNRQCSSFDFNLDLLFLRSSSAFIRYSLSLSSISTGGIHSARVNPSITSALRKSNRFELKLENSKGRLVSPSCTLCVREYLMGWLAALDISVMTPRSLYSSASFSQESKARPTGSGQIASSFGRTTGNKETCLCAEKNSIPARWAMQLK